MYSLPSGIITRTAGGGMSGKLSIPSIVFGLAALVGGGHIGVAAASQPGIGSQFVIAPDLTTPDSDQVRPGRPGIAFDGTNYLVVSCRDLDVPPGIIGVFVSAQGQAGSPFPIASVSSCSTQLDVAFDGANYLVAYRN